METIRTINVEAPAGHSEIVLIWGNLMAFEKSGLIDILVVSTFPHDYTPTQTSVVGALKSHGVDLAELAANKAVDLGVEFGCWLSHDIRHLRSGVPARRILCIEGSNPQRLFRSLVAILSDESERITLAMPVIGTGDGGDLFEDVFPNILEAAVEWILMGLPVSRLEIVIPNKKRAQEAGIMFERFVADRVVSAVQLKPPQLDARPFDVFVSYAHEEPEPAVAILEALKGRRIRVFMDRKDLDPGKIWQLEILKELDNCRRIVPVLSANYLESPMCIEEFNIAMMRQRSERREILTPLYWRTAALPTYMKQFQWIDCREADNAKIRNAATTLAALIT